MKLFKFRDSKLIDSFEPDLIALEAKGLQGSKVLLEGKPNTIKPHCYSTRLNPIKRVLSSVAFQHCQNGTC